MGTLNMEGFYDVNIAFNKRSGVDVFIVGKGSHHYDYYCNLPKWVTSRIPNGTIDYDSPLSFEVEVAVIEDYCPKTQPVTPVPSRSNSPERERKKLKTEKKG